MESIFEQLHKMNLLDFSELGIQKDEAEIAHQEMERDLVEGLNKNETEEQGFNNE